MIAILFLLNRGFRREVWRATTFAIALYFQSSTAASCTSVPTFRIEAGENISYLIGSIHTISSSTDITEICQNPAFETVDRVYFESVPDAAPNQGARIDQRRERQLAPADARAFRETLLRLVTQPRDQRPWTFDDDKFVQLDPYDLVSTISSTCLQNIPSSRRLYSLDRSLKTLLAKRGATFYDLEDPNVYIAEFKAVRIEEWQRMAEMAYEYLQANCTPSPAYYSDRTIAAYLNGNIEELFEIQREAYAAMGMSIYFTTLSSSTRRETELAKKISEISRGRQGRIFVVGALHVRESDGLPAILRKAGLKVTRVQ